MESGTSLQRITVAQAGLLQGYCGLRSPAYGGPSEPRPEIAEGYCYSRRAFSLGKIGLPTRRREIGEDVESFSDPIPDPARHCRETAARGIQRCSPIL